MTALSPDGQNLACYSSNGLLTLVEVRTGNEILRTKGYSEEYSTMEFLGRLEPLPFFRENSFLSLTFSPDARYFVGLGSETLGYDLTERHPVSIKGSLGSAKRIVFLNADRALVSKDLFSPNAEIVSFPSGRLLSKTEAPVARWSAATRGDYIIWHPQSGARVAVFSLSNGNNILSSKVATAMDLYDQTLVSEARDGEIGLAKVETRQSIAQLALPSGSLSGFEAVAVSPDLGWLAVSNSERGAIWNLSTGNRPYYIRGFRGAYMPDDRACYAEFPKFEEALHSIEYLSLTSQSIQRVVSLDSNYVENYGSVYVIRKWEGGRPQPGRKVTIEVYDVRLGKLLWSRDFAKSAPWLMGRSGEDSLILLWNLSSSEAWDEIQTLPLWKERFRSVSHDRGNYLIEIVEAQTGKPLGALAIATGNLSFHVVRGSAGGGWVVLTDNQNRLHLYALASGEEKGTLFGQWASLSKSGELLAAQNGQHLTLFGLASLEERDDFTFKSPIVFTQFSSDGNRLLVLTRDQSAYTLNVSGAP